jgi:hypothetical protein
MQEEGGALFARSYMGGQNRRITLPWPKGLEVSLHNYLPVTRDCMVFRLGRD